MSKMILCACVCMVLGDRWVIVMYSISKIISTLAKRTMKEVSKKLTFNRCLSNKSYVRGSSSKVRTISSTSTLAFNLLFETLNLIFCSFNFSFSLFRIFIEFGTLTSSRSS